MGASCGFFYFWTNSRFFLGCLCLSSTAQLFLELKSFLFVDLISIHLKERSAEFYFLL